MEIFKVLDNGNIICIPLNKKFSILKAEPNNIDIFNGSHKDKNGKSGTSGVIYFTSKAAERECIKQGKKLLKDKSEIEKFVDFFPGENIKEKISSFVNLFGFKKSGFFYLQVQQWCYIEEMGFIVLSEPPKDFEEVFDEYNKKGLMPPFSNRDDVDTIMRSDDDASIFLVDKNSPSPYIVYEDC